MSDNKFNYTYSAPTEQERREINSIRRQYEPQSDKETKLQRLRFLDTRVKSIPQIIALCIGVIGALIFGLGLTMVLQWDLIVWGILIMVLGAPVIAIAYPLHNYVLTKYKEKYGEEILKLSEELLNEK